MKITRKLGIIMLIILTMFPTADIGNIVYAVGSDEKSLLNSSNDDNNPILETYQDGNMIKSEWAVPDMLPENVLYETGFEEGDELPNLIYGSIDKGGGRTGGQSFTTEHSFSGERSLKVHDTYTNGQQSGNAINGVVPFSNTSRARFTDTKFIDKGIDLSMSIRVKSTAPSIIDPSAQGVNADYGVTAKEKFTADVKAGDTTVKIDDISRFKKAVDEGRMLYLADSKINYKQILVTGYNEANSTITVRSAFNDNFKAGENVIDRRWMIPLSFPNRTINSNEWTTINMNTKVPSYDFYDISKRGFSFVLYNSTRGTMYIDDFKMGLATEAELYKDGQQIYKGKLSDYEDRNVIDTTKPAKVSGYNVKFDSNKQYINIIEPEDYGNDYSYQVKATSEDGTGEYWSDIKTIEYTTGIAGYSYVIDTNPATNPSGTINSSNGEIEIDDQIYKDHYLHIQAIDGSGNKSEVSHIKLDKIRDITPPVLNTQQSPTNWTNGNVVINVNSEDPQSGVNNIMYIGDNMVRNPDFSQGQTAWQLGTHNHWGDARLENGIVVLDDNDIESNDNPIRNRFRQLNAFTGSELGVTYYAEIVARGNGRVNARYEVNNNNFPEDYSQLVDSDEFKTYRMLIERKSNNIDNLVVERIGEGAIEIKEVRVFAEKEITDNQLTVTANDSFKFVSTNNEGLFTVKEHEVTNIDKEAPSVSISQDINDTTHKNVTLTVNAEDGGSGIKRIMYEGDSMLRNGDFSENLSEWTMPRNSAGMSDIEVVDGVAIMHNVGDGLRSRLQQPNAFAGSTLGSTYYAEVTARGEGILNARYAVSGGSFQDNYAQELNSEFTTHRFIIERGPGHTNGFIVERKGNGYTEISDVKVYAQSDLTDTKELIVTANGTYNFIVEDNAGNITTVSHEVTNIERKLSMEQPEVEGSVSLDISADMKAELSIDDLTITDWRDNGNNWSLYLEASNLSNENHELSSGVVSIKGIDSIQRIDGDEETEKLTYLQNRTIIDNGRVRLIDSLRQRGAYSVNFKDKSLELNIPVGDVKKGTYNTKLTWTLESTADIQ